MRRQVAKTKTEVGIYFYFLANEPTEAVSISTNVMFEMKINSSICRPRIRAVPLAFPYRVA